MYRVNDFANGHFLLKVCYVCVSKLLSARMRSTKHKKRKTDQNWGTNNFLFVLFFCFFSVLVIKDWACCLYLAWSFLRFFWFVLFILLLYASIKNSFAMYFHSVSNKLTYIDRVKAVHRPDYSPYRSFLICCIKIYNVFTTFEW